MSEGKMLVLFGSETGNAEDLAFDTGKKAEDYGLDADVKGMDEVTIDDLSGCANLVICCSTWGDGDQPDNAQDLFDSVMESDNASMEGVNFAVLALGDTAFDMFCQSGKEWDEILEERGGTRVNDRVDCDVDYEDDAEEWMESTLEKFSNL